MTARKTPNAISDLSFARQLPIISVSPENGFALFALNTGTVTRPLGTCKRQGATKCFGVSCRRPYNRLARGLLDLNSSP